MKFMSRHKVLSVFIFLFTLFIYINFTSPTTPNLKVDKSSKYYVNDLYMSSNNAYNHLNDNEKKMYDLIFESAKKYKQKININLQEQGCSNINECIEYANKAQSAIWVDHPELLQFGWISWTYTNTDLTIKINYAVSSEIETDIGVAYMKHQIEKIKKSTKNLNDREKIIYVYEWIGHHAKYDKVFTGLSKNQSAYNVFVKKNAVCAGFAKASQIILQNVGIDSECIEGDSGGGRHMWNVVTVDGKNYYYDSTYSASISRDSSYYYYGLNQTNLIKYVAAFPDWYGKIETDELFEITKN